MSNDPIAYIAVFCAALVVTFLATPFAARLALRLGAVDKPSARRINTVVTPRMGGVAVFLGLAAAAAVQYFGTKVLEWPVVLVSGPRMTVDYHWLAAAFLVIFLTGAIDDVYQLKPIPKLAGQLVAATIAVCGGLVIGHVVNPFGEGEIVLGWAAYPITIVYLVAYANIINLIDGLDGLASGISCIASVTMFVLGVNAGRLDASALSIALAGATLGFLYYNFHPASIFLGDSGALTLGFALGTVSLLNVTRIAGLTTTLIPLVVAAVPILDTFSAIVRRRRAHVSVGQADKGHIHHRLILQQGFDQRQAVLIIYAWTALLCLGAVIMTQVQLVPRICIFLLLVAGSMVMAQKLHLFEPVLRHHYNPVTHEDELVSPDDPAFKIEEERAAEAHAEAHEGHIEQLEQLAEHLHIGEK